MKKLLEELFCTYYKDIYHYLYSLSRNASLSEDLSQEVFLDALRGIGGFRHQSDIKTWLFSIARHKWYSHLRQIQRQPEQVVLTDVMESSSPTPEVQYQSQEMIARIYTLLEAEPERTQKILTMRWEGLSFYEISSQLGISENSARVIAFRAKTKIAQQLQKEGFTCE